MRGMMSTLLVSVSAMALGNAAFADVEISNKPTSNMSCGSGACTATAQKATLNVGDLATMLASGDVAVKTGSVAKDIDIDQPLQWTSTARLTLDAQESVTVNKQVTVAGQGGLTVITNDTGERKKKSDGEFVIVPQHGSVELWDLGSSLIIDGNSYTLVGDIKTLASDIAANPSGFYALAKPYDASGDGTYTSVPIGGSFAGVFEGLGNTFSNVSMRIVGDDGILFGFFEQIADTGVIRDTGLENISLTGVGAFWGTLAGQNFGVVEGCWASGSVRVAAAGLAGLIGGNDGLISRCAVDVEVISARQTGLSAIAGLTAVNDGLISQSSSKGRVAASGAFSSAGGGLVGRNYTGGRIIDSYSVSTVHSGRDNCCKYGGLIGENSKGASVVSSYAAGAISHGKAQESPLGGVVGFVDGRGTDFKDAYWDLDKGVSNPARGAGNKKNEMGITGLTDSELKNQLPSGFDPKVWEQKTQVNHGLPYLLNAPNK
jgi:hypothetical protein